MRIVWSFNRRCVLIYTDNTRKAIKLCFDAHAGQLDKSGLPYVLHPLHVAEQMDDEESTVAALLHDVAEDTDYTLDDIREMGFGERVVRALALLTHDKDVPYMDYVRKLADDPIARKVKLADLAHNSDMTRFDHEPTEEDLKRMQKYREAMMILEHTE